MLLGFAVGASGYGLIFTGNSIPALAQTPPAAPAGMSKPLRLAASVPPFTTIANLTSASVEIAEPEQSLAIASVRATALPAVVAVGGVTTIPSLLPILI